MKELFYNGEILTMEKELYADILLTEDGKITYAGPVDGIAAADRKEAVKTDLQGRALLPAFIDAHSHLSAVANSYLQIDLENADDFDEIKSTIEQYIHKNKIEKGKWIICKGYDHNRLKEHKHPDRDLLDAAAPHNPAVIQHQSGHMGVFNTSALALLNVTEQTQAPGGGMIGRSGGRLTGYMEESVFVEYLQKLPPPAEKELLNAYIQAQQKYASYGIATVQDGMMVDSMAPIYQALAKQNLLYLDTVGYVGIDQGILLDMFSDKHYRNHFRIGGYKIFLDGSPQAKTAWMETPYQSGGENNCGYGTMTDGNVYKAVEKACKNGVQLLAHCNGDAACAQLIGALQKADEKGFDVKKIRPVMVHAQLLRPDQLDAVCRLGLIPSFFIGHVYHWGDVHIRNFGQKRASLISPAGAALQKNILFTFHQDSPVTEPNMLESIWCAVNRTTKNGTILGNDQAVPVLEAIKAVTINAAYQYFEETEKGSLKKGKAADLVILEQNPLKTAKEKIREIKVLRTIKNGKTVFG